MLKLNLSIEIYIIYQLRNSKVRPIYEKDQAVMVYNDLFNYGLFIHMTYLSYGRMSPQQKNNQQSSVFDMLYAFDWHYLYVSLS